MTTSSPSNSTQKKHVVIPARYGSQRYPGKPLADILGKPMIQWVYNLVDHSAFDSVIIATDHKDIAAKAEAFGATVAMTSPSCASGTDRLAEVARQRNWDRQDIVVNLQGDEPTFPTAWLSTLVNVMEDNQTAQIATLAHPFRNMDDVLNPNRVKVVVNQRQEALYFSRSPIPYDRFHTLAPHDFWQHLGVYAYRVGDLLRISTTPQCSLESIEGLEQLRALDLGMTIVVGFVAVLNRDLEANSIEDDMPPLGVDTPEDLERVIAWLKRRSSTQ